MSFPRGAEAGAAGPRTDLFLFTSQCGGQINGGDIAVFASRAPAHGVSSTHPALFAPSVVTPGRFDLLLPGWEDLLWRAPRRVPEATLRSLRRVRAGSTP